MGPKPASAAAFLDLSGRAKLRLRGSDRVRYLNGQVSNDVRRLSADGSPSLYACVMTIKGKMCADVFIHGLADALLVDAEAELRETLAARLERYIVADDVQLDDVSDDCGLIHWLEPGPPSTEPAAALPPEILPALGALGAMDLPARAVRCRRFGREGWDIVFATTLRDAILGILCPLGREAVPDDFEPLRIAAGFGRWGAELDENTMPAEASLEARAVDYAKGCYIGQEIVSRVKSVGHVNRHLCGLRATGGATLAPGMALLPDPAPDAPSPAARGASRITSAAYDAARGECIALGYVRRGWDTPGTRLRAVAAPAGGEAPTAPGCAVEVCALPF